MTRLAHVALLVCAWVLLAAPAGRDAGAVRAFRQAHPCPSTGLTSGACPGWVVDHKWPLCAGGADEPANMQWEEYRQSLAKDRVEIALCRARATRCP